MGREDEGSDLWEWETPRGLFLLPDCERLEVVLVQFLSDSCSFQEVL